MTGLDLLALQVAALKNQIGAMQAQLLAMDQAIENMQANAEPIGCQHEETENRGTFGVPDIRCTACDAQVAA
jgi:hypothetical protein